MGVTITEIARLAGVSHTSVSKVLNGATIRISENRRTRILELARELNYVPNQTAKALKTGKHGAIAVIAYDITDAFAVECVTMIEKYLANTQYRALWMSCAHADQNKMSPENLLRDAAQSVDGIIIIHAPNYLTDASILKFWAATQKPIVTVIRSVPGNLIPSVTIDNQLGTGLVLQHLIELGHRRIAYCYPKDKDPSAEQRYLTFKELMKERYHLPLEKQWQIPVGGTVKEGYDAGKNILELVKPPTAILGFNDLTAIGLLKACYDLSVKVPQDISIASYDNIRMAQNVAPALTTVAPNYNEIATFAIKKLVAQIAPVSSTSEAANHHAIKPKLIVRDSTQKLQCAMAGSC